ncbi:MAG: twin-arginine translocation signal domain-containing protein [Fimbriimonadaceae bacterium]
MPKPTRREFLSGAAAAAASLPALASTAQDDLSKFTRNLAKPLSEEAKAKLKANLEYTAATLKAREEFKLPENSEPATVYRVSPAGGK